MIETLAELIREYLSDYYSTEIVHLNLILIKWRGYDVMQLYISGVSCCFCVKFKPIEAHSLSDPKLLEDIASEVKRCRADSTTRNHRQDTLATMNLVMQCCTMLGWPK